MLSVVMVGDVVGEGSSHGGGRGYHTSEGERLLAVEQTMESSRRVTERLYFPK